MPKPVIFLAFANDREDNARYLRNIPAEYNAIRNILNLAQDKGLCEVEMLPYSTFQDIKNVFAAEKYRNRIAVFHFSGHADGFQLLLENAEGNNEIAHGKGLIDYFTILKTQHIQENLQLLFFNGCCTAQLGESLKSVIPATIGTVNSINDTQAKAIAVSFYEKLSEQIDIKTAFDLAKAESHVGNANLRGLYRKDLANEPTAEPWKLYFKEEKELKWKLGKTNESTILHTYFRKPFIFQPKNSFLRTLWRAMPFLDFKKSYYKALAKIDNDSRFEWKFSISKEDKEHIINIFKRYIPLHTATGNLKHGAKSFPQIKGKKPDICKVLLKYIDLSPKIILLLGESGMGKTMILQKTFVELAQKYPLFPIAFVYCGVDTDAQIDAIFQVYPHKNIILFIDAFDEDLQARRGNYKERYTEIMTRVADCYKIYISAREHLFEHDKDIPNTHNHKGTPLIFERIVISKMNTKQIGLFLDKFFGKEIIVENGHKVLKADKAKKMIKKKEDTLYYRPLILSNLEFLFDDSAQANYNFNYQVYAQILRKWAERELPIFFPDETLNDKQIDLKTNKILVAAKNLAKYLFRQEKQSVQTQPMLGVKASELPQVVRLSEPKRSFVKRENDLYVFAHQAFYDYFLALMLFKQQIREEDFRKHIKTSKESLLLYQEMLLHKVLGEKRKTFDLEKADYLYEYEENIRKLLTASNNLYIMALLKKYADKSQLDGFTEHEYWYKIIPFLENVCTEKHYVFEEYKKYEWAYFFLFYQVGSKEAEYFDLEALPAQVEELRNLQQLDLGFNELTNLPAEIGQLRNLQQLDLGLNELTSLPAEIGQLQNLQKLHLSNSPNLDFKDVFLKLKSLPNLQELNLSSNQLTNLPAEIGQLQNLQKLHLSGNPNLDFKDVFLILKSLPNLQELDLVFNELTNLPAEIGQLQNLQILDLWDNQLTNLPAEIGQLQNLQILCLSSNCNLDFKDVFLKLKSLPNLQQLDLGLNQLTSLPAEIGQLQNLQILYLEENQLTNLPAEIGQLQNLQKLNLSDNPNLDFKDVFLILKSLPNLQELSLDFNQLTNLPAEIGQLQNLQGLSLWGNNFSPKEQEKIKKLLPNCKIGF